MNRARIFLRCYAETGSVTGAAAAARIHRSTHYRRLKSDPTYQAAFEAAGEVAIGVLEDEALRRAVEGVPEPVTYQGQFSYLPKLDEADNVVLDPEGRPIRGKLVSIRRYSDSLLMFLLRGARPEKYRERHHMDVNANIAVTKFKGSLEDLLATYRNLVSQENDPEAA